MRPATRSWTFAHIPGIMPVLAIINLLALLPARRGIGQVVHVARDAGFVAVHAVKWNSVELASIVEVEELVDAADMKRAVVDISVDELGWEVVGAFHA